MVTTTPEITPTRRRILRGTRHVEVLGLPAHTLSASIQHGRVRIDAITSHGDHIDIDTNPADALELGLALIAHAEWVIAHP
jgi:hypothetical protein